jgi:hypothetical protein
MRSQIFRVAIAGLIVMLMACGGAARPTQPSVGTSSSSGESDNSGAGGSSGTGGSSGGPAGAPLPARQILMMDACDPTTFNAAIEPGTCVQRHGGVKFDQFIAELTRNQKAGAWHFAPPNTTAREGQTLVATNHGGEVHTFTRVQEFGGGIVPLLNQLSGNPDIAPECTRLDADDFVPPDGTYEEEVGSEETQLFECCIHPWMRTVVHTE